MAWTQVERDALASTIAKGLLTVEYDGKRLTFQSLDQMISLLREMDAQLAGDQLGGRIGTVYATFTRE